jgi:hypothetical protein
MNEPTSINARRRNPLSYNPTRGVFLDGALFFGGVAATIALPEVICSLVGGSRVATAVIASMIIGTGWGVMRFYFSPFKISSCLSKEPVPKAPPGAAVKLKLAREC